jgi:hypothetical protein
MLYAHEILSVSVRLIIGYAGCRAPVSARKPAGTSGAAVTTCASTRARYDNAIDPMFHVFSARNIEYASMRTKFVLLVATCKFRTARYLNAAGNEPSTGGCWG